MFNLFSLIAVMSVFFIFCETRKYQIDEFPDCALQDQQDHGWVNFANCRPSEDCTKIKDLTGKKLRLKCKDYKREPNVAVSKQVECIKTEESYKYTPKWYFAGLGWTKKTIESEGWRVICHPHDDLGNSMYDSKTGTTTGMRAKACAQSNVKPTEICGTGCVDMANLIGKENVHHGLKSYCPNNRALQKSYVCKSMGLQNPTDIGLYGVCSVPNSAHSEYYDKLDGDGAFHNYYDSVAMDGGYRTFSGYYDGYANLHTAILLLILVVFCCVMCLMSTACFGVGCFIFGHKVSPKSQVKPIAASSEDEV